MARHQSEFALNCIIADLLREVAKPRVYWTALPFGEKRPARAGERLRRMGARAGAPDILLIVKGQAYGLELKTAEGRLSPEQVATAEAWEQAGGTYCVAHGYAPAVEFLTRIGAIHPVHDNARFRPRVAA